MGSMLSLRKADYGTCQGVRNTPYQHYTDSQLSIHLYGCKSTAPSPLLPPAIWRVGQVLPPQLDMKLDSYCPHIFSLVNVCRIFVQMCITPNVSGGKAQFFRASIEGSE